MRKLNQHEQSLVGSIEDAIRLSRSGTSPNDAIYKVAKDEGRGPEYIKRMCEGFNKSKTVDYLSKTAADTRSSNFDIADSDVIIQRLYTPPVQKTASEFSIPTDDFSFADMNSGLSQKVASIRDNSSELPEHPGTIMGRLEKHAHVVEGIRRKLHTRVTENRYGFDRSIEKVAEIMSPFSERQLRKVAQKVVNGYPDTGGTLVKIIGKKMHRPMPELDKTANSVIFPTEEPYLSISKVFEYAEKMARAEVDKAHFEKESGIADSVTGSTISALMRKGLNSGAPEAEGKFNDSKEDALDPKFHNELRGLDARRQFLDLALYDPDLSKFDIQDLERAYNTTVGTIQDSYDNPVVLRNTMLRNLQQSGKEPHELKTELEIQKMLADKGNFSSQDSSSTPTPGAPR